MGIGILLKDLILKQKTSVIDVSRATGVPATTIYSIIKRNSKSANISDLYKIAHHLGVTLDYFYNGETKDNSNLFLTDHEKAVISAYRDQPSMREAVDKLLGTTESK